MPKKKKKGRAAREAAANNNNTEIRGTPSSSQKKQSKPTFQSDVISVRVIKGSSSGKRTMKYSPTVLLHESDASKLDVVVGDRVFLLSTTESLPQQIKRLEVARVKISDGNFESSSTPRSALFGGTGSGRGNSQKKSKLTPGNCNLFPLSLAETFLLGDQDIRQDAATIGTPKTSVSNPITTPTMVQESTPKVESSSKSKFSFAKGGGGDQLIASPPPKQTPSSSSKSKFSFAKGGGGDQLISPTASINNTTPSTPSSIRSKSNTKILIQIVPFDSDLGDTLASMFCRPAKTISIRRQPLEKEIDNQMQDRKPQDSPEIGLPLRQHLVVAHTAGEYLTHGASFSVSVQGQTVAYEVDRADHDRINDNINALAVDLKGLSIDGAGKEQTIKMSEPEESLRSSLSKMTDEERKSMLLYCIDHDTKVSFVTNNDVADSPIRTDDETDETVPQTIQPKTMVAGLDETYKQVLSALETPLRHPELFKGSLGSLKPPKGILLHGPSGIGKSALALQVGQHFASSGAYHVERIHCTALQSQTAFVGQAEARLVKLFADAQRPRPGKNGCLLILDDVHLICPRREGIDLGADRLASTLLALLDGMKTSNSINSKTFYPTIILAITTDPGALDAALRRPGRLDSEIEVPLPDEPSIRLKILKFQLELLEAETRFSDSEWLSLARLAKGFTGADLKLAAKEALRNALLQNSGNRTLSFAIMKKAIVSTKPSAIKSVTVEVPSVPWSSIGGMEEVKKQLRDAIELPLTHGATFKRLGIRPPRGVLLYGPPGCSKTLMARALATEGQMNFLAVKGPELLSKWLGESERALAALFRRARLASPSIIFFDEVDAIASKRGGGSSGGGERLLSQLLTELDGIQQSRDSSAKESRVVIVCATNRPDLIDGALMRPGRIDRMIYVGVPDERSRENILKIGLKNSCATNIDVSDDIPEVKPTSHAMMEELNSQNLSFSLV